MRGIGESRDWSSLPSVCTRLSSWHQRAAPLTSGELASCGWRSSAWPWASSQFWLAWAVHAAEALYTVRLCSTKGITDPGARMQWLMQTFLFGIASLSLLLAYKPGKKKR
ncbi:transmembrane protein 254 isoform X2 [Hyla sarda]|uniref:transmembrane protein 254 isoform X2 n=1 Tax=Hyla sarda TaxID=327740 RepID=UPI0024C33281|nr:transmembrane protein 254 isoform X2 [Hyla sarda]